MATFATGTPVANSLGELYVMQSYLRPDLLADSGTADINDWGNTFTATVNTVEANATGTGLHPVTRVGKFTNLQELLALSSAFTDVVTRTQVASGRTGLTLPELVGGRRKIVTITPARRSRTSSPTWPTAPRTSTPPHGPRQHPQNQQRRPQRVAGPAAGEPGQTRNLPRENGGRRNHADTPPDRRQRLPIPGHQSPMERTGGLQIVFCDRGTPKQGQSFSMYSAIRDELVEQGMDPAAIRFIHDARTAEDRLRLFDECNRGAVSVLIGSTEKMGTGTNVQTRAVALHHVDVPWRPADLEQREGG